MPDSLVSDELKEQDLVVTGLDKVLQKVEVSEKVYFNTLCEEQK